MKGKIVSILTVLSLFLGLLTLQFTLDAFSNIATKDKAAENRMKILEMKVENLSVKAINGNLVSVKNIQEPLVLINFWATWCVPCIREFESMKKLQETLGKDKIKIIGINCDQETPKSKILKFINKHQLDFTITLDEKHLILDDFGLENLPASIIYNKKNIIYFSNKFTDFMDNDLLKKLSKSIK